MVFLLIKLLSDNDVKDQLAEFERKILSRQDQQTKALLQCLNNIFPENNSQLDVIRSKLGAVSRNDLPNRVKTVKNKGKDLKALRNAKNTKHKSDTGMTKTFSTLVLKPIENTLDNLKVRHPETLKKPALDTKENIDKRKICCSFRGFGPLSKLNRLEEISVQLLI